MRGVSRIDHVGSPGWLVVRAPPGIGALFPRPTLALRTGEASYLAPSARTDRLSNSATELEK